MKRSTRGTGVYASLVDTGSNLTDLGRVRAVRQVEPFRDLLVGQPGRGERGDLEFLMCELIGTGAVQGWSRRASGTLFADGPPCPRLGAMTLEDAQCRLEAEP